MAATDARWHRVWIDKQGRLRLWQKRSVKRRSVRLPGSRGFQLVNDGPKMGMMLARLVAFYGEELGLLDGCDDADPRGPGDEAGLLDFAA